MLPILLLVGCGDISNAWILEDAAFLDALPSEERHTVALEATAAKGLGDPPTLLQLSYGVSRQVNLTIFEVLGAIDNVRATLPTERTEDGRRWGPYPFRADVDVQVWVTRNGAGRFDWGVDAVSGGEAIPYITGTHYAGETVAAGDGAFTWTFDEVAELAGDPARGTVVVDYDNREGVDLLVAIDGVTDGTSDPVTADYAYRFVAEEGDFQYVSPLDVNSDGVPDDVRVRTRWLADHAGRADAVLTVDPYTDRWTQCWDASLGLTHEDDDLGLVTPVGDEADCVYAEFAEVDRL